MATQTVEMVKRTPPKKRLNRFDSPWLNRRFIIGVVMIGFVVVAGVFGPLFWDTRLSLVGSSPLNLPPMWVHIEAKTAVFPAAPVEGTPVPATATKGGFGGSGLSGSGLVSLMNTGTPQTSDASATPTKGGFGGSGLSGSGLVSLMNTGTPATAAASVTPTKGGFGGSGLSGSGLVSLMNTGTPAAEPTSAESEVDATPVPISNNSSAPVLTSDKPSGDRAHPLGTDNSGRDILAVLIVGAPASLRIGVIAAIVGLLVSIVLGFTAGFMGGWVDTVIRTMADVAVTIPALAVLLVISSYLHRIDLDTMALLLALFSWPAPTRLIRAQVLTLRERGYVRMAQLSGQSTFSIMFKEMLPNMLPYLAASLAGNISGAILAATSLEALGLGPTRFPTLGTTLFNALRSTAIMRNMYWWWGFPVLVLAFIFTGLFQLATGLDEIANPRLRGRGKL